VEIAQLQAYGYFVLIAVLVFVLYGYIYHLYAKKKDADGHDYEEYSNLALHDDLADTLVNAKSETQEK